MNKIIRKLTTRPVWWLETRRPYPIRDAWKRLPPIQAKNGPLSFAVLTTPRTFNDALWTAWSWLRFLKDAVRLEIYVDGSLDDKMRRSLDQLLPGSGLFEAIPAIMAGDGFPRDVESFILDHPMGRKLGLYFLQQTRGKFLYSDADVLAFNEPSELLQALAFPGGGAYFCEETAGSFTPEIVKRAGQLGITPLESFNAGLLLIPGNSLSRETASELLRDWKAHVGDWFIEQTVLACLLRPALMMPLPRNRYVLAEARQFYWQPDVDYSRIAARHFTGTTRHVMYLKGMPWILRSLSENQEPAE